MSKKPIATETIIGAFVKCRDALNAKRKEFKAYEQDMKSQMAILEKELLIRCQKEGVESFKTKSGTAYKKKKDWIKVTDWPTAIGTIITDDLIHMLNKSVNKTACKEYMQENNGALPPGLEYGSMVEIGIRR